MNTKQKLQLIRDAFNRLAFLNNVARGGYLDRLHAQCVEEERGHRGFGHDFAKYHPGAVSVTDAARLFSVKRIAEYLNGERMPRGKEFLHVQKSCFHAAALVDEFRKDIRRAWRGLDVKALTELDYCEFVKVREP